MKKGIIKTPFFEIGAKNYMYGEELLKVAKAADQAAIEHDIDVIFIAPYADIRLLAEHTRRLLIFAPYMDSLRPGRGLAAILPEGIKAAGAKGVMLNHSEKPMTLPELEATIKRAKELDLLTLVCAGSIQEAQAVACFAPDIINPEESELIGSGSVSDADFVERSTQAIRQINPHILVEHAAGITTGQQVESLILAGADGAGAASGVFKAEDPLAKSQEFILAVRKAIAIMSAERDEYRLRIMNKLSIN